MTEPKDLLPDQRVSPIPSENRNGETRDGDLLAMREAEVKALRARVERLEAVLRIYRVSSEG